MGVDDSLGSALEQLAGWRARGTRASEEIVSKGVRVLEQGGLRKMGDEAWAFLEQLALAALDIGRLDLADECLEQLVEEFPGSPRVECLKGIRIEADQQPGMALSFYEAALKEDDTNVALWKREIAVLRGQGTQSAQRAVDELTRYLDIFYTDVEGWMELADMYAELNLYALSLQALAHVLLLAAQNPFYMLRFAETAYTAGDVPLALKAYLCVVDMDAGRAAQRAWWGVHLSASRLLLCASTPSVSETRVPAREHLRLLDGLARERVSGAYRSRGTAAGGSEIQGGAVVLAWLERVCT